MRKLFRRLRIWVICAAIKRADSYEVNEIITTVVKRYAQVFPNWETAFVTVPKDDPDKRKRTLESFSSILEEGCK